MAVSDNLRVIRVQRNLTQKELGDLMYVSDKTISTWESGRSLPDIESIKQLAVVLNVRYEILVDGEMRLQKLFSKIKKFWNDNRIVCTNVLVLLVVYLLLVIPDPVFSFFAGFIGLAAYLGYLSITKSKWFAIPLLLALMEIIEQGSLYLYINIGFDYILVILAVLFLSSVAQIIILIINLIRHKKIYYIGILSNINHILVIVLLFISFGVSNGSAGGQVERISMYLLYTLISVVLLGLNRIKLVDSK